MRVFTFNKDWSVICQSQSTRSGFRHLATIMFCNYDRATVKCTYLNRTWETYEFQTVLCKALEKMKP